RQGPRVLHDVARAARAAIRAQVREEAVGAAGIEGVRRDGCQSPSTVERHLRVRVPLVLGPGSATPALVDVERRSREGLALTCRLMTGEPKLVEACRGLAAVRPVSLRGHERRREREEQGGANQQMSEHRSASSCRILSSTKLALFVPPRAGGGLRGAAARLATCCQRKLAIGRAAAKCGCSQKGP